MGTRPNISESHSEISTRVPFCTAQAELDFTQGTTTKYSETPTRDKTLSLSASLIAKYAKFL